MLDLSGTHGTCLSRAEAIRASGEWVQTDVGRAGRGVYFWEYEGYSAVAKELAILWWHFKHRDGHYSDDTDPQCAIIYADICTEGDLFLDCNDASFESTLYRVLAKLEEGLGERDPIDDSLIHSAYELVIAELEAVFGRSFKVIRARVPLPSTKGIPFKKKPYLPSPNCYVVRHGFEGIAIQAIENIKETAP